MKHIMGSSHLLFIAASHFMIAVSGSGNHCPEVPECYQPTTCAAIKEDVDVKDCCPSCVCSWCPKNGPPNCVNKPDLECSSSTVVNKVDCHPHPDANENNCYELGCHWCPKKAPKSVPWCFYPKNSICTRVDPSDRIQCGDDGITQEECLHINGHYCPTNVKGVPWCFHDPKSPCVTYPDELRHDCKPNQPTNRADCLSSGCHWCPNPDRRDIPWCFLDQSVTLQPTCLDIADDEKLDCHPDENVEQQRCASRYCNWCAESDTAPPCYYDTRDWDHFPDQRENFRVNGHPEPGATREKCQSRGFIWQEGSTPNVPPCYIPATHGYTAVNKVKKLRTGYSVKLRRHPFPPQCGGHCPNTIQMIITTISKSLFSFKIFDPDNARYEVPVETVTEEIDVDEPSLEYEFKFYHKPSFSVVAKRKSTGSVLLDTRDGGLVFCKQFVQLHTRVASEHVYGFGQNDHPTFRHDMNWETLPLLTRDGTNGNLNGGLPFYTVTETDGKTNGVLFLNSNDQEVQLTPAPGLSYRTAGGILEFFIFCGPTPKKVHQELAKLFGLTNSMPALWCLGVHFGQDSQDLQALKKSIESNRNNGIPQDVVFRKSAIQSKMAGYTYDAESYQASLQAQSEYVEYANERKAEGLKFVTPVESVISIRQNNQYNNYTAKSYDPFKHGCKHDVWIKRHDGTTALGKVSPDTIVVYTDPASPHAQEWYASRLTNDPYVQPWNGIELRELSTTADGDARYGRCRVNLHNNPPYKPRELITGTTCADDKQYDDYLLYDTRNLQGLQHCNVIYNAIIQQTNTRPFVVTRSSSSFPSIGKFAAVSFGHNLESWVDMKKAFIELVKTSTSATPLVGPSISEPTGTGSPEQTERYCRWFQFLSFNTLCRVPQDLSAYGEEVAAVAKDAFLIRYTLLPYLYWLFYTFVTKGTPVVRALQHVFPKDIHARDIYTQFLWGKGILFCPVSEPGEYVKVYFPPSELWYEYDTGKLVTTTGRKQKISAPKQTLPAFVRGGTIIPTQEPALNTEESWRTPLGLIVAPDERGKAEGEIFLDDGKSLGTITDKKYYTATTRFADNTLRVIPQDTNCEESNSRKYGLCRIFTRNKVERVRVNGKRHDYVQNPDTKEITVDAASRNIRIDQPLTITLIESSA